MKFETEHYIYLGYLHRNGTVDSEDVLVFVTLDGNKAKSSVLKYNNEYNLKRQYTLIKLRITPDTNIEWDLDCLPMTLTTRKVVIAAPNKHK